MNAIILPRPIGDNDPFDIDFTAESAAFVGCLGIEPPPLDGTAARFCRFIDMAHGVRAGARTLHTYVFRDIVEPTIEAIVSRLAPRKENNTEAYIAFVCTETGRGRTDKFDLSTYGDLALISRAVMYEECGKAVALAHIADVDFVHGVRMALGPGDRASSMRRTKSPKGHSARDREIPQNLR